MNDDDQHVEADERDERTAALLEVPPLDDLTRRRLVQRALSEAGPAAPARGARFLRVAAVVVGVVAIGGAAALVLRDGGGTNRDAARTTASEPDVAGGAEDQPEAFEAAPVTRDLGEVSGPEDLRRRLQALADEPPATPSPTEEEGAAADTEASSAGLTPECLAALEAVEAPPVSIVGSAVYQGALALVVAATSGEEAFVLGLADPARCPLLATVPLV